jgi:Type IIA topoisomerase (DNA gyrase/topo II, topoisomerase IV), A subunit
VLPDRFPNLLCNGSSGIDVGMATNILRTTCPRWQKACIGRSNIREPSP